MSAPSLASLLAVKPPNGFDPARAPIWLWSADGARLIYASRGAMALSGVRNLEAVDAEALKQASRRAAELGQQLGPDAPPRLERLRFIFGGNVEALTCLCKLVRLAEGGEAVLVAAFGLRVMAAEEAVEETALPAAVAESNPLDQKAEALPQALVAPEEGVARQRVEEPAPEEAAKEAVPQDVLPEPAAATELPMAELETTEAEASEPVEAAASLDQVKGESAPAVPHQPAPIPEWLRKTPDQRRPLRFTWASDGEGRLSALSAIFTDVTGIDAAGLIGKTWDEALGQCELDGKDRLRQFLSDTQTMSAIKIGWHMPEFGHLVPVEISGVPVFGAERRFSGFRGFGIFRLDQTETVPAWIEDEKPIETPLAETAEELHSANPSDHAVAAELPKIEPSDTEVMAELPEKIAEQVLHAEEHPATQLAEPTSSETVAPIERPVAQQVADEATEEAAADPVAPFAETKEADSAPIAEGDSSEIGEAAGSKPEEVSRIAVEPPPAETSTQPTPEAPRMPRAGAFTPTAGTVTAMRGIKTTIGAHLGNPKVVPLRVGGQEASPAAPAGEASLSSAERNAFREIAKALGARMPDDAVPVKPSAPAVADDLSSSASEPPAAIEPAAAKEPAPMEQASVPAEAETAAPVQVVATTQAETIAASTGRLLERMPFGLLVLRGETPLHANKSFFDLVGYEDIAELIREGGVARLFQGRSVDSVDQGGPLVIGRRDGSSFPADVHALSIDWIGGPAMAMLFRRASEVENAPGLESLQLEMQSQQRQIREARAMLDTATDGVISMDGKGRVLGLNRSAEALFGFDQNEVAGERFTMLLSPESHPAAIDYLEGLKANGVASVLNDGREVMGRERKGGRIPLFMTIGRVSEDGGEAKFAAVLRDITNWKRAEAELTDAKRQADRANAQKSDFLAKISHEIRTPLNAIIGFAEVMKQEQLGPIGNERYKEYLNDIHVSGQHVMSLINDLLDLSKIEAGRMELAFTSVDLNDIVAGCIGLMQPQANRDHVIMRSHLAPRLPRVVADERSVRQIVLNLLSNASKFTEAGGQVIVSTAMTDRGEAVIRVRDTGVGMTDKDIETALEPFRRVQTAHPKSGTGLGLPLTKALTEANRANLSIRSKPKEGTLVEVTFPPTRVLAE